jgi:cytochrome c oxidase subunit IV
MSETIVPVRTYVAVYLTLLVLTGLTTGVAFVDLGLGSPIVALTIAVVKAAVVILFFMHLRSSTRLTWVVGGAAVFWLAILLTLTMSDYLTRSWGRL